MKYKLLTEGCEPYKKYETDAGWDLKTTTSLKFRVGEVKKAPLGISVAIPKGYVGLLIPRSSFGEKGLSLANGTGVIDSDYRGEVIAMIRNAGNRILRIEKGDRIAQLVVVPFYTEKLMKVTKLDSTERGEGGFGSTGTR